MPSSSEVRALVFDIGQVIVRINPMLMADALAAHVGASTENLMVEIELDLNLLEFQEGRLTPEQWHQHLCRRLGLKLSFQQFCEAWNRTLGDTLINDDLLVKLASRYRLLLLSNTDPIHEAHMAKRYSFLQYFPIQLLSCVVGESKPSDAIYAKAIAAAGVQPRRILYIDDIPEYLEAGQRAGMQTYHFQGQPALLAEFRTRGILA